MIIPQGTGLLVQLDSLNVTDSPLSVTNIKTSNVLFTLTSLNDYPSVDRPVSPTDQFK